ncbi:hypothetical protein Cgig2_025316 [Carnegiea gigantea]|uniref:Uncharacterized protein n=1 Tax=Carnegiea gigantea TaxID=171969 RepID=A0A9Q1QAD6_9CARY|nr:hypothetical protein Cgig2_010853 [Carnegiea gigantea]KAJ8434176.1 hypothetical protein Cgig2_025316 [Carnegiea gigantea]
MPNALTQPIFKDILVIVKSPGAPYPPKVGNNSCTSLINPIEGLSLKYILYLELLEEFEVNLKLTKQPLIEKGYALSNLKICVIRSKCYKNGHTSFTRADGLKQLRSLLGILIKINKPIVEKTMMNYARLFVEVQLDGPSVGYVDFITNKGLITIQKVEFE